MKYYFIVEDDFGPQFIKALFRKKSDEGIFSGMLVKAKQYSIGPKMSRIAKAATRNADRIVILMDADGKPHKEWTRHIESFLSDVDMNYVRIVLLDHEIEEWICHSQGIKFDEKPSKILKASISYKKNQLPKYALKLDCEKLKTCSSFERLMLALRSDDRI